MISWSFKQVHAPGLGVPHGGRNPFAVMSPSARPLFASASVHDKLKVAFEPHSYQVGEFSSVLHLHIVWSNGAVEDRFVTLMGASRLERNIPEDNVRVPIGYENPIAAPRSEDKPGAQASLSAFATEAKIALNGKFDLLRDAATSLTTNQRDGVHLAEAEARGFVAAVPDLSLATEILFVAMNVATAGIAGSIGQAAKTLMVKHLAMDKDGALTALFTDGLKEAVKYTAKLKLDDMKAAKRRPPAEGAGEGADSEGSIDPMVEFFRTQRVIVDAAGSRLKKSISAHEGVAGRHVDADPEAAIASVSAMTMLLEQEVGKRVPETLQSTASALAWISALAKSELGTERAFTRDYRQSVEVSRLTPRGRAAAGVLNLYVDPPRPGEPLTVTRAELRGASYATAAHLLNIRLGETGVPIAINIEQADGTIAAYTVDEAGRILRGDELAWEENAIRPTHAESSVNIGRNLLVDLLGTKLSQHGLDEVRTNDRRQQNR